MSKLEPVQATPYLTIVAGRTPRQKIHSRLGDAKNAFDTPKLNENVTHPKYRGKQYTHGWGELYEFKDGRWVLLYEVVQPEQKDMIEKGNGNWITYDWETRPWKLGN